ncbi:hypothetical protein Cme02nite_03110 [Catellatospora methionotrophica]|uniref:histidine kinase n=1 Tax=Catellatospora methionotrophica TaxID=121620 RepID=A0A8J3LA94_9ACTN|nr:ATP-binding protein [Catellatospora methionotrophica]GIG11979.1 hypothetical protein Cme02nite_03110 [Catellatospora methionotrophica]
MTDRRRPVTAWVVLAVTSVLSVGSAAGWLVAAPRWDPWMLYSLVDWLVGAVYGVVAWLMLSRRGHLAAWIMAAAGIGGAASAALATWAVLGEARPAVLPPAVLLGAMYWLWIPGSYALTVVLPWLLPIRRFGPLDRFAVGAGAAFIVVVQLSTMSDPAESWRPLPVDDPALLAGRAAVTPWLNVGWLALTLAAAAGVIARRRRASPPDRRGLGWLAIGITLLGLAIGPLALHTAWGVPVYGPLAPALMLAAQLFFPAAVLVVVLRQRLWGMELAVGRTLVWALMTCIVIGGYTVVVLVADRVLVMPSVVPQALATALLAAAFLPVRQWVQARVDRLVHGEGDRRLIRQVADRLRTADRGQVMLDAVAAGIAQSLRLERVTVASGDSPVPPDGGDVLTLRLTSQGRVVAVLRAWPRPGERLGRRAVSTLGDLAPVVTALVDLAAAQGEIDLARDRTARARDEERRRLRRDLHDGLGPAFSGLALGLAAVRNMLRSRRDDPAVAAADELVGQLAAEADRQAAAVRDVARAVMPPLLDDGALAPALDQLRERYVAAGLAIEVRARPGLLPGDLATAVYGIVAEAVRNVHRHAAVDRCIIDVMNGPGGLEVSVTDHGAGIDADAATGVGTRAMHERAAGVGGTLTITTPPGGGTRVRLLVPAGTR